MRLIVEGLFSSRIAQANTSPNLISKRTRAKWAGGMAQTVDCLLCKHEALNSNPSPTKKKKKEEGNFVGLGTWGHGSSGTTPV
jgi:hypothetical protein